MFGYDVYKWLRDEIVPGLTKLQPAGVASGWAKRMGKQLDADETYYLAKFATDCDAMSPQPTL